MSSKMVFLGISALSLFLLGYAWYHGRKRKKNNTGFPWHFRCDARDEKESHKFLNYTKYPILQGLPFYIEMQGTVYEKDKKIFANLQIKLQDKCYKHIRIFVIYISQ